MMGGWYMGYGWVWAMVPMLVLMALMWGLMRARSSTDGAGSRNHAGPDQARAILRERFARGEITEKELRERLSALDKP